MRKRNAVMITMMSDQNLKVLQHGSAKGNMMLSQTGFKPQQIYTNLSSTKNNQGNIQSFNKTATQEMNGGARKP